MQGNGVMGMSLRSGVRWINHLQEEDSTGSAGKNLRQESGGFLKTPSSRLPSMPQDPRAQKMLIVGGGNIGPK